MKKTMMTALAAVCVVAMLPATSGAVVVYSDDFETLSAAVAGGGQGITNGWVSSGPELKQYNYNDTINGNDFTGRLGFVDTGLGAFDTVQVGFGGVTLANIGDYVTLTMDYEMQGDVGSGGRLRLYQSNAGDVLQHVGAYGVNFASGASTAGAGYIIRTAGGAFGGTANDGGAVSNAAFGAGGTISLTATKTGASEITLGGAFSGSTTNVVFADVVQATSFYTFDALGISVGSAAMGIAIDNVVVTSNIPEPATLGLMGIAGIMAFAFRRRRMK